MPGFLEAVVDKFGPGDLSARVIRDDPVDPGQRAAGLGDPGRAYDLPAPHCPHIVHVPLDCRAAVAGRCRRDAADGVRQ